MGEETTTAITRQIKRRQCNSFYIQEAGQKLQAMKEEAVRKLLTTAIKRQIRHRQYYSYKAGEHEHTTAALERAERKLHENHCKMFWTFVKD